MGSAAGGYVDLRSDTVTRPSPAMRRAMAQAEVGDDLFGDDPTVNRLQDLAAEMTGLPAALYLPTGTMCNQIAMHVFARSGHWWCASRRPHRRDGGVVVRGASPARLPPRARLRPGACWPARRWPRRSTPDPYGIEPWSTW